MKIRIIKPTKDQIDKESLNWRFHSKEEKECKLCHSKFKYGQKKTETCGLCKIMMVCNICNKEFEYKFSKSGREYYIDLKLKNKIINNEVDDLKIVCPNCIKEYNSGYCSICNKFNLLRDGANRGRDIFYGDGEWLNENNDICGCECSHKYYLKHNSSDIMKKVSSKNVAKYLNPLKERWKNGGICLECGKYNKILDQRGRGKDIPYNYDSEWILDKDIIDLETNKIIAHKGQKCGCNCSQKIQIDIAIKSANKKSQPGECILCHRNTKLDNPPSNRTVFGVCNICQANLVNKMNNQKRIKIENGEMEDWGGCMSNEWIIFNCSIPCNPQCIQKDICQNNKDCLKNKWGYCEEIIKNGFGNLKYNNIEIIHCDKCDHKTPHKYNKDHKLYCQVCAGEKIWCDHCQQYENPEFNSHPEHWLFYKSRTRNWMIEHPEQFDYIQLLIDFKDNILGSEPIRGIYLWRIDDVPYYCGDSNDILSRSYDHMYEMWNSPEYWLDIKNEYINKDHTISLEILQVCDNSISDQEMHEKQIEWINTVKPVSQKCDGTDHIIPLNERKFTLKKLI